ncbi:leucine-rich repeat domain-containing protein [Flavobacterium crassostreae]|nr:T9SS type A sorting domain-containing protein [Flavobacterium crassostreae]
MKFRKLLFLLLGTTLYSYAQPADAVLYQLLLNANNTNTIALDNTGNAITIDNGDGIITAAEAQQVYALNLKHTYGNRIVRLDDLQIFTNLNVLDLYDNNISSIAPIHQLPIKELDLGFNRALELQVLDLTALTNLQKISAVAIGLNGITVNNLTNLTFIDVSYNFITNIDITSNPNLEQLFLNYNTVNAISYNSPNSLKILHAEKNNLSTSFFVNMTNLEDLVLSENQYSTLDVTSLNNLKKLTCDYNQITSLNLGALNQITNLSCANNQLTNLSLTNLVTLEDLRCSNNLLTTLDVLESPLLNTLICSYNSLTTLDLSNASLLSSLACNNNNLSSLYLKNNGPSLNGEGFSFNNNPNINYICEDASEINFINDFLIQYGYTGVTVTSNCTLGTTAVTTKPANYTLSPNPTDGILNLAYSDNTENIISISVFNTLGQEVLYTQSNFKKIDLSSLISGNYIVKITTKVGVLTSKIIKH